MFTFITVSIVFPLKNGDAGSSLSAADRLKIISPSIIDKLEQSYFATGYM